MASSSVDSELQPHTVAEFPTRAHSGRGFQMYPGDLGTQFPKLTRGFIQIAFTGNLTGVLYGWMSWLGLKFSIYVTACLHLFKGQKLSKLCSRKFTHMGGFQIFQINYYWPDFTLRLQASIHQQTLFTLCFSLWNVSVNQLINFWL